VRSAEEDRVEPYPVASAPTRDIQKMGKPGIKCPTCVIGDTGTGVHIVGRDKLADSELRMIDNSGPSVRLNTANGQTKTQDRISVMSRALGGQFEDIVLKTSPNAISVGHYCMDCGYWFKWPPGKDPYFVKPNGDVVRFYVHNNVPYLDEEHFVTALPAGDEEDGAIEVMELHEGDLVPGGNANVGGSEIDAVDNWGMPRKAAKRI
jgi:hypothetical protein